MTGLRSIVLRDSGDRKLNEVMNTAKPMALGWWFRRDLTMNQFDGVKKTSSVASQLLSW